MSYVNYISIKYVRKRRSKDPSPLSPLMGAEFKSTSSSQRAHSLHISNDPARSTGGWALGSKDPLSAQGLLGSKAKAAFSLPRASPWGRAPSLGGDKALPLRLWSLQSRGFLGLTPAHASLGPGILSSCEVAGLPSHCRLCPLNPTPRCISCSRKESCS